MSVQGLVFFSHGQLESLKPFLNQALPLSYLFIPSWFHHFEQACCHSFLPVYVQCLCPPLPPNPSARGCCFLVASTSFIPQVLSWSQEGFCSQCQEEQARFSLACVGEKKKMPMPENSSLPSAAPSELRAGEGRGRRSCSIPGSDQMVPQLRTPKHCIYLTRCLLLVKFSYMAK